MEKKKDGKKVLSDGKPKSKLKTVLIIILSVILVLLVVGIVIMGIPMLLTHINIHSPPQTDNGTNKNQNSSQKSEEGTIQTQTADHDELRNVVIGALQEIASEMQVDPVSELDLRQVDTENLLEHLHQIHQKVTTESFLQD